MPVTIAERRKKIRQARARLQIDETLAGLDERRERTARIYRRGGMIEEKPALANMDDATLDFVLDEIDAAAKDPKTMQRLTKGGIEKAARVAEEKNQPTRLITITFVGVVEPATSAAMREAGFRLNRLRGLWEGLVSPHKAAGLAATYGGKMEIVDTGPAEVPLAAE